MLSLLDCLIFASISLLDCIEGSWSALLTTYSAGGSGDATGWAPEGALKGSFRKIVFRVRPIPLFFLLMFCYSTNVLFSPMFFIKLLYVVRVNIQDVDHGGFASGTLTAKILKNTRPKLVGTRIPS